MPEVAVRADVGLAGRKMHRFHNALDRCLPLQNAAIGVQSEPLCPFVEDDPATWRLFVFNLARHGPENTAAPSSSRYDWSGGLNNRHKALLH